MRDLRDLVFKNHKDYLFNASGNFTDLITEMRGQVKEYLKDYGFDVVETPQDTLRVFYKKGEAYKTREELKQYLPVETFKTYYEFIEITI